MLDEAYKDGYDVGYSDAMCDITTRFKNHINVMAENIFEEVRFLEKKDHVGMPSRNKVKGECA